MAKSRSPNFPMVDLAQAIEGISKIYAEEKRATFPKDSSVEHLGYTSINGRSLGMLAALKAYGLLNGRGDDLQVSDRAVAILEAPKETDDYEMALLDAFHSPPMFGRIIEQYEDIPSEKTLRWWLVQQGFTSDGAEKAAETYLSSARLVSPILGEYKGPEEDELDKEEPVEAATEPNIRKRTRPDTVVREPLVPAGTARPDFIVKLGNGRIAIIEIKGGEANASHLEKLQRFINLQRELIEDDEPGTPPMPSGDGRDYQAEYEES